MKKPLAVAALAAAAAVAADAPLRGGAAAFPRLSELPSTPFATQDAALASAGLRAAGADLAWIELLQYAAQGLPELPERNGAPFGWLLPMTLRVTRLDPHFHRAYLYGAGVLGWFQGVGRPEEAVEILREGLRRDPGQKLYALYIAALAYRKKGDVDKMVALLESVLDDPQAPVMMRPILANIYKARGDYRKALALWEYILDDEREPSEHQRAVKQIEELTHLLRGRRAKVRP